MTAKAKTKRRKYKLIFVCTGNTCRSPMAEVLFTHLLRQKRKLSAYDVSGAGLDAAAGAPMTDNAAAAVKQLGVPLRKKIAAKQLTPEAVQNADLVVCMTAGHAAALRAFGDKVRTVSEITGGPDVPDPCGGDLSVYVRTAEYLRYACEDIFALTEKLRAEKP